MKVEGCRAEARRGRGVYPVLDEVPPDFMHKRAPDGPAVRENRHLRLDAGESPAPWSEPVFLSAAEVSACKK